MFRKIQAETLTVEPLLDKTVRRPKISKFTRYGTFFVNFAKFFRTPRLYETPKKGYF